MTSDPQPVRAVLDTNVVMALWHFADPGLPRLRAWCRGDAARLLSRADGLDELRRVLAYAQFGIAPARQAALLADYTAATAVLPEPDAALQAELDTLPRCRDRDDQKFLSAAWQGGAGLLLTRDKLVLRLAKRPPFRERLRILTPEQFERELQAGAAAP
ncbi:MAG: PIN domain-containing protein [Candidatus Dactylopiibacterium sp.]|nr:PIN domain-containing protein [Candidatus Dactylopiibacterium sp.]